MRTVWIIIICFAAVVVCAAQITAVPVLDDEDVQSWNDLQLTMPLAKKVDFTTKLTLRLGKNISRLNDGRFMIGTVWKPTKALSISPFYWYISARNSAGRFRIEHRLNLSATYRFPFSVRGWGLSHRSTYERRLRQPANTWRYRAMMTFDHDIPANVIPKAKFFVGDEVFYDSATGRVSRNRFSIGVTKTISKELSLDLYYTRQNDGFSHPGDLNIIWSALEDPSMRSGGDTVMKLGKTILSAVTSLAILLSCACLPGTPTDSAGSQTITLYGFSIMKEVLEKEIYPAFAAKWKREHGVDVGFVSSFAGSETVTNQILQGTPADVAILSIDRDATRLREGGAVTSDWHAFPHNGIVNKTPFVILVRKGNPKGIQDFPDLGKPGIKVIHPDPVSSGGAQWSILSIYGSELKKSENESGSRDSVRALHTLQAIWKNVISTPGSAREARTQFETGYGDALITYELEGMLMRAAGAEIDVVVPKSTIFSEHPIVAVDRNIDAAKRPIVDAFIEYLWTDEAQKAFVKFHFRSVTNDAFNTENKEFATIEQPFTVEMFGGWDKAYPDVIEKVSRDQVQVKK